MRSIRHRRQLAVLTIGLGLAIQLAVAPSAAADSGKAVTHAHRADGMTRGELMGQAWSEWYSSPASTQFQCMRLGKTGHVLLAADPNTTCTLERSDPVLLFFGTTCDNVVDPLVDPSWYAADKKAQRKCAKAWDSKLIADEKVTVDHGKPVDIHTRCYEAFSPQEHVFMPKGNFYGVSARWATFVAHGWPALVDHLSLGLHTIDFEVDWAGGEPDISTRTVNVVPRHDD